MANRREILARAVLLSAGVGLARTLPANAASLHKFAPDREPLIFSRKLVRGPAGGEAIEVERHFQIEIVPGASGFQISGKQTGVKVSAPAPLQALADIERRRVETGLFPIELNENGLIRAGRPLSATQATKDAVSKALELLDSPNTISDPVLYRQFLMQVQKHAAQFMSHLPSDLFSPPDQPVVSKREIPLPGELVGEVEVVYKAASDPDTGLMTAARREVTTRIGSDSRTAQEVWSIASA